MRISGLKVSRLARPADFETDLSVVGRFRTVQARRRRPGWQVAVEFVQARQYFVGFKISGQGQDGVVGRVIGLVVLAQVGGAQAVQVGGIANDFVMVG